jgi:hypothetical protein
MKKKPYDSRLKHRCILQIHFDPSYDYKRKADVLRSAGNSEAEIRAIIGNPPIKVDDSSLIARSLNYTFDPSKKGRYHVGRFNDQNFPALYTASDIDTARAERGHWYKKSEDAAFVIFTIKFSGVARDIRDDISSGKLPFPDDYVQCQRYAVEAMKAGCDGIAAPSKRDLRGSCCAIFAKDCVVGDNVASRGSFPHP